MERAARSIVDENGVWLYHENINPTENGFWAEAKDLQVGDIFLGVNGELLTLAATERVVFPEGIKVYNFSVEGNHNYFILAQVGDYGQTCILVHNANKKNPCGVEDKPTWDPESTTPIHKQLKGTGQIAAFERMKFPGHDSRDLLLKSPAQIVKMLKDEKITAKVVKTITKFFQMRDLRHGK